MRVSDLFEGVVSRRGNKLQVGSLELQLYPDHIFYVVNGGKDADLSIYKDGAFKPPRNNEIYLKDAASRGVPQAFINLFAKFFVTQDIDVVVNGLETLFKSHVKEDIDEALLSPSVHEIFLKGLIGAILSGGLSLGIDYAKEKTADYDKQGLQAVYKSIDPREYPQLTKKLTPHDRKGLDAILGKLKEHAMRMEDITEGNKENKAKLKNLKLPREKNKVSDFDPRRDLKKKVAEEDKSMSRAGKGVMKYGKDGMKALAKAGREGASDEKIDKLRDKYDKYDEALEEKWSKKYKDSINCSNPKGFSQKAHCAGKKKVKESEYGSEGSFLKNELQTIARVAHHLANDLENDENVPTWVISKISQSKGMLVGAMDYMISKHERGIQPMDEEKQRLDPKCWKGYRKAGTKMKGGVHVNNCVKSGK